MHKFEKLLTLFKTINSKIVDIKIVNLCTTDGFPMCSHVFDSSLKIDGEKLSAVTSSIAALSLATSKQLIGAKFSSTTIETENGTMFLVKTQYQQKDCILCFITGNDQKLGSVRYFANKLADIIKNSNMPTV